jgi:hypothetical protein
LPQFYTHFRGGLHQQEWLQKSGLAVERVVDLVG